MKKKRLKLNFDLSKHDKKVQARADQELAHDTAETLSKLNRAYEQLMQRLRMKRAPGGKPGTGVTADDLKKFVADCEKLIETECVGAHLADFRAFSLELIREKAELLRLTEMHKPQAEWSNVFTPLESMSVLSNEMNAAELPEKLRPPTVRYTFKERGQFEMLEPIRRTLMADGYVGLVLDDNRLMAVWDDGGFRVLGVVANGIGLGHVPSREQYVKALKEKK